jgi:hypothetical protein
MSLLTAIRALISSESTSSIALQEETSYVDKDLDRELKIEDIRTRKEFTQLLKQNREERKKYAHHIFILTCIWATLIFTILIANGIKSINSKKFFEFELSDKVLITLITSTTLNFFGFFLLVVKYLFRVDSDKSSKKKVKEKSET